MTYVLKWTNPASLNPTITIADGTANITTVIGGGGYPITLTGKGYLSWGQPLQQNLLYILENFADSSPPNPTIYGQTWFNTTSNRLTVNAGPTSPDFLELAYRNITLTPVSPQQSDLYYHNHVLNVYDGGWQPLALATQTYGNYSLDTGAVNAYVVALVPPITSYTTNFAGSFKVGIANTGASTLNAGAGPVPLVTDQGAALVVGDLTVGAIVSYLFIQADSRAYITSITKSQLDAGYANIAGNALLNFEVATAVDLNDAVPLSQAQIFGVPTGTIIDFAGTVAPSGYVQCPLVQKLVSISGIYANLYAVIGFAWGGGGTLFGLPYFPADNTAVQAATVGVIGSETGGQVISHNHLIGSNNGEAGGGSPAYEYMNSYGNGVSYNTSYTGGPANLAAGMRVMKCVKL